jgi:YjjI family glycine radical enzyme
MSDVMNIIKDKTLTFEQRVIALAKLAENSIDVLGVSDETKEWLENGIICDLFEGNAPYRPRYIVVDFEKFMREGSKFLELTPPTDIWEAVNNLLIFYKHIPSITTMPVYIGNIDKLLEPFVEDEETAYKAIKLFLNHIDKTVTDSFCHANIGPEASRAGSLILQASKELNNPTPNITMKYSETETDDDFAIQAVQTSLKTAKPSFANNAIFGDDFNGNYAIVSCYNGLNIGGGSYTLVRSRLAKLAEQAEDVDDFMNRLLPDLVERMAGYMDKRVKFIVEESVFFENNFLVEEGFVHKDRFTAMFGIVGLAECVNTLLGATDEVADKKRRFGHNIQADQLGEKIIKELDRLVGLHEAPYCEVSGGRYLLHSQVGIDTDEGSSPGCRIPIGEEPEMHEHIVQSAPFHKYFPSGIGDIFSFDETAEKNPHYILDIIKGAFKTGLRYFSLYEDNSDVIRITGYLVKKSEMEKLDKNKAVLRDTTVLGRGNRDYAKTFERKVRDSK